MHYSEDTELKKHTDTTEDQHLILDGTANLDYSDDDVPRIKGLIELLKEYFGTKNTWNFNQAEAPSRKQALPSSSLAATFGHNRTSG